MTQDSLGQLRYPIGRFLWCELSGALALYAWHSQHHVAHITELVKAKGWVVG